LEPRLSNYKIDKGNGKQETRYKISMVIPDTEIAPFLSLPALQTQWSEFSENGDAEAFGKELDDGKQSISLRAGIGSSRVQQAMPLLAAEQVATIAALKKYHHDMVTFAFDNLPPKGCVHATKARSKAKKELKDGTAEEIEDRARAIYLDGAHCGGVVEKDIDDEPVELIVVKRKVCTYEKGVKGRYPPIFHKGNRTGGFNAVEIDKYVPRRTLVEIRARPQYFTAPLMYGTTLSLDRDIIMVWRPKKRSRSRSSRVVPYFEDGEGDTVDSDDADSAKKPRLE